MHKNVFSYFIGFLLSGILLFISFGARYPSLFFIWGAALLLGTAFFIIVRKCLASHLDPRILEDKYCNHFLWIYNEEHSALLTNLFISMKFVLLVAFFTLVLIPIKDAVISSFSLLPLILLALFVCVSKPVLQNTALIIRRSTAVGKHSLPKMKEFISTNL